MHQEDVRRKIQTSQLINRLQKHALGELELSPSQIKAIEVLIKKTLPDLSAVEMKMDADVRVREYDLGQLDDSELATVEAALAKAAIPGTGEGGMGEAEADPLH